MSDVLLATLAFVAKRQGRRTLPHGTWVHVLSLDLGWLSPSQAKAYLEAGLAAGLLQHDGDELAFTRDAATIAVPLGFRPPPTLGAAMPTASPMARPAAVAPSMAPAAVPVPAPAPPVDPVVAWLGKLAAARKVDRAVVLQDMEQQQARFGGLLDAEAALLLMAERAGLPVRDEARAALTARQASAATRAARARP